jgi:hypothetical protein
MRHLLAAPVLHGDSNFLHSPARSPVQEVIDNRDISCIQLCFSSDDMLNKIIKSMQ